MDICLCTGQNCPLKQDCYRFTAPVYGRCDFFATIPYQHNACQYFKSNESQIREIAYYLWLNDGKKEGESEKYWLEAKEQVKK